ncbi:putative Rap guanine nucleotide exchange factor [Triangularia verruculosa]|uniref:Rap guanine nucleotide exchange factor n=1 Tax=Triangularia verruculosa TaxID=2587418 RepID=A0AAN7AWR9_9PEZI|nr:putative Rap guanine nucleotide exchange factor [Triangularia verruculosa]
MRAHTHHSSSDRRPGGLPKESAPFATPRAPPASSLPSPDFGAQGSFLLLDEPTAGGQRDSVASIVDDPFFIRYHSTAPNTTSPTTATPGTPSALTTSAGHRNEERQPWIPPRKDSLKDIGPTPWFDRNKPAMEAINIAIIGVEGVGKSAFVQRTIRSTRPPTQNMITFRHVLDGTHYSVTLVELDLEGFELDPRHPIQWPKQVAGHMVPRIDGALILYDITNRESVRGLDSTMAALANSSLPTVLAATKCDAPEEAREIDVAEVASAFPTCAGHFRTSFNAPGTAQDCLQAALKAALANRRGEYDKPEGSMTRRRAASATLDAPQDMINGRPISQHSKHSRASSDLSLLRGFPPPPNESHYRPQASRSPRLDYSSVAQPSNQGLGLPVPEDGPQQTVSAMLRQPGIRLDGGAESFLDVSESDGESYRYSDDIPILQRSDENFLDRPAKIAGVSFDDLVDRLVAPKMTKADQNFADIFICLYRKFAAPSELLNAIRARLDQLKEDKTTHILIKAEAQARLVECVAKWVSLYPGDFARPATKRSLDDLVKQLAIDPLFFTAAQQMRVHLEHKVVEDDDTGWGKSDPIDETDNMFEGLSRPQSGITGSMNSLQLDDPSAPPGHRRPSQSSERSGSDIHGRTTARYQLHTFEDYEREAATLVPIPTLALNKFRWHQFMEFEIDDIADEMTRMDWVMFSSIRIRDLVRHVSLNQEQKDKCKSLKNVNRMISHFNHVAKWVANMILIRDKAKHRAPCLERFMLIALRLRQLNNYNGLAAVLAGINGTSIHRLSQTRQLVSTETQKKFARLVLLMGTQKSHFAYRLAWENSPLPRIPFMPLHRRDLVSAEEGSKTFVGANGERINWKKFEVLGEVLLPIMKSQGMPYQGLESQQQQQKKGGVVEGVRELILDGKLMTDEEDIYQRSVQVEASSAAGAAGAGESTKKKFPWLAK